MEERQNALPENAQRELLPGEEYKPLLGAERQWAEVTPYSVLTGLPTVLGWHTHEWLWHNSSEPVDERGAEISEFYTGIDSPRKNLFYLFRQSRGGYIPILWYFLEQRVPDTPAHSICFISCGSIS